MYFDAERSDLQLFDLEKYFRPSRNSDQTDLFLWLSSVSIRDMMARIEFGEDLTFQQTRFQPHLESASRRPERNLIP